MSQYNEELIIDYLAKNDLRGLSNIKIADRINQDLKLGYEGTEFLRKKIAKLKGKVNTTTTTNDYKEPQTHFSAKGDDGRMMDIESYCEHYNLPRKDIKSYKLVTHTAVPYYNIAFYESVESQTISEDFINDLIDDILNRSSTKQKSRPITFKAQSRVGRLVYTDVHIGMEVNDKGLSLYGGKWDEEEIMSRLHSMIDTFLIECKRNNINEVYIDDLGDFMDGWNAQTTRGGHDLPQNMDNEKAFDVGLNFKVYIVDALFNSGIIDKVVCNNVTEDNHSGSFGYVVNKAAKQVLERNYSENFLEYNIFRKFIDVSVIGKHAHLLCHGKDSKNLKFGFKTKLDDKGADKITQFIHHNEIAKDYPFIEFSKGDGHQQLFDSSTSDEFDYFCYPAFSASSGWVQVNFKRGRSGYVIQLIDKEDRDKTIIPKSFKWSN